MSDPLVDQPQKIDLQEPQNIVEKRITIDGKTLIIPPAIQIEMMKLDDILRDSDYASEIFGWGITQNKDDVTIEVIEFIGPKRENIFELRNFIVTDDQVRLARILSSAVSLSLEIRPNEVVIVPDNSDKPDDGMHFAINPDTQRISWTLPTDNLALLFGFEVPDNLSGLQEAIAAKRLERKIPDTIPNFPLKSDWDIIVSSTGGWITGGYIEHTIERAGELDADIGFSMHHHPTLGILRMVQKSRAENEKMYNTLLACSRKDIDFMTTMGVEFFEIRVFGDPDHPWDPDSGITTSRYYRTSLLQ